jgi:hypothetical protein
MVLDLKRGRRMREGKLKRRNNIPCRWSCDECVRQSCGRGEVAEEYDGGC